MTQSKLDLSRFPQTSLRDGPSPIQHLPRLSRKLGGAEIYVASLNHAIWWHRPLRADDWLLFDCISPSGAIGRGLSIGRVYDRAGRLVASATQECLLAPMGEWRATRSSPMSRA